MCAGRVSGGAGSGSGCECVHEGDPYRGVCFCLESESSAFHVDVGCDSDWDDLRGSRALTAGRSTAGQEL